MELEKYTFIELNNNYDYGAFAANSKRKSGINYFLCKSPDNNMPFFLRIVFKIHTSSKINSIIELPLKRVWVKYFLTKTAIHAARSSQNICFIVGDSLKLVFETGLFTFLKRLFPSCKIVYSFGDKVESYLFDINKNGGLDGFKQQVDLLLTYNKVDSEKYGILLNRPRFPVYEVDNCPVQYDAVFIGREKGRLKTLISLYDYLVEKGFRCFFYIMGVPKEKQIKRKNIVYSSSYLPYSETIKLSSMSKCIINIIQRGASGITLRDYEAIGMNKILITNNKDIKEYIFYSERKTIFVDEDDISKTDLSLIKVFDNLEKWNNSDEYSSRKYYEWLISKLNDNLDYEK